MIWKDYLTPEDLGVMIKKEDNKMLMNETNPIGPMFNGVFGKVAPDMCRLTMSGKIAIKTSGGYKSYNVKTGRLTNCDQFAFPVGQDAFFVVPTNKVKPGDIILVSGKPHCVISTDKKHIEAFCYEDSSVHTIVPEHHVFMTKSYIYGKIISVFGDVGSEGGIKNMMKFAMMSQMMSGKGGDVASVWFPMMLMGGGDMGSIFDGMFDFSEEAEEESEGEDE